MFIVASPDLGLLQSTEGNMSDLISEKYVKELKQLHSASSSFGIGSVTAKHYPLILEIAKKHSLVSIFDYGCGKGHFIDHVKNTMPEITVTGFDVASEKWSILPEESFDLTVCLDVMEHVEFGALSSVLQEIKLRTKKVFICSVANYPAAKKLADGRNAHVTQMPFGYWFNLLSMYFRIDQFKRTAKQEGLFICTTLRTDSDWR